MNISAFIWGDEHSICKGDRAYIFHRSDPEFWHVNHVILGEREVLAEKIAVKVDTFANYSEYFW